MLRPAQHTAATVVALDPCRLFDRFSLISLSGRWGESARERTTVRPTPSPPIRAGLAEAGSGKLKVKHSVPLFNTLYLQVKMRSAFLPHSGRQPAHLEAQLSYEVIALGGWQSGRP